MKKTLKVLSIDFDYFQNVKKDTITSCYPDGLDLSSEITSIIWATHYGSDYEKLSEVKINKKHFAQISKIIKNQDEDVRFMVAQSHKHIYNFIKDNYSEKKYKECSIINVDMHHDCFNNNPELDCGNWVGHIKKDIKNCNVTWIANKISASVYGIKDLPIQTGLEEILNKKFDLIFLCRSDTWLPPHLDIYFHQLSSYIAENYHTLIEKAVMTPRNFKEIMKMAEEYKNAIQKIQSA